MIVAGVMSGTSLDGIDVAVVEIKGAQRVRTIGFQTSPYPPAIHHALLAISGGSGVFSAPVQEVTAAISRLNFELGEAYAKAVGRAVKRFGPVELIGCHGQTIYHEGARHTLQIGEAGVIAERTGVPVVSNFRARDIAAGGQGAPLVPYVDYLLFRSPKRARVALNIGGIANITVVPKGARPEDVIAFDTGPGNMVIDALVTEFTRGKLRYDRSGKIAAAGNVDTGLLDDMLAGPYYSQKPPKSVGREQFGVEFVEWLKLRRLSTPDLITTATVFTAAAIAKGVNLAFNGPADLIVSGGGAHNPVIMAHLAAFLPQCAVSTSSDHGIDVDAKEAIAFAILAHATWIGKPGNLPSATGAARAVRLGDLTV